MSKQTAYKHVLHLFFTLVILSVYQIAVALPTDTMNYQGYLTDDTGIPVDGPVSIVFAIYNVDVGGVPVWSDVRSVTVDEGVFSVELGGVSNPFPLGMFDLPLWVGLTVGTDAEMTPRRPVSGVGFSFKAGDAETAEPDIEAVSPHERVRFHVAPSCAAIQYGFLLAERHQHGARNQAASQTADRSAASRLLAAE